MASIVGDYLAKVSDPAVIDTVQQEAFGTRGMDENGNVYVYLKGITNTLAGSWVTFDELGVTALLATDAIGPVAVASAATNANTKFGWYMVAGTCNAQLAANCAADKNIGVEGASGVAGDGQAAGDTIVGAISRGSTSTAAAAAVQLYYPLVNDITGS